MQEESTRGYTITREREKERDLFENGNTTNQYNNNHN